ncbi:MAG TPA: PQQ-binding-like beta-propeller repeat protein [Gemmatimonadales bacterium]|nr:PQQ-binding-like beta-propeller repeat protein [Gemmatimonadales bacterium]
MNFRPDPAELPAAAAGNAPSESWTVDGGRGATPPMVTEEGRVYLAGADRQVRAIDIETGQEVWHRRLTGTILGGVLLRDSVLYLATSRPDGRVHALDARDGSSNWKASAGDIAAPLAIAGGAVAGVNRDGELVALELSNGRERWRRQIGISRLPPLASGNGFLVSAGDSLLQLDAATGRISARGRLPFAMIGWQQLDGLLIGATTDSAIVGLHPATFAVVWRALLDGPVLGSVGVQADTAWAVTRRGTLYEIDLDSPTSPRRVTAFTAPITTGVTPIGEHLVLGGADGVLRGITRTGEVVWRLNLTWNITVDPVPVPGGFLAAGGDGDLHRFAE